MKKNVKKETSFIDKKKLMIGLSIVLLLFIVYGIYVFKIEYIKEGKIEVNSKMEITKKYDGLEINNIRFIKTKRKIYLKFNIKNNTNKNYNQKEAKLVFLDKKGEVIKKKNIIIPEVKQEEIIEKAMTVDKEITDAHNFLIADE